MKSEQNREEWNTLSENIRWLRKRYHLSKKDMAAILDIGIGSFNKVEKGELPPRLGVDILFNIQHYFGIQPQALLTKRLEPQCEVLKQQSKTPKQKTER